MSEYCKAKCPECGTVLKNIKLSSKYPIYLAKCPKCELAKRVELNKSKPALGCKPYYVSISQRICELCEAIIRNVSDIKNDHNKIRMWATEIICLIEVDRTMQRQEKQKVFHEDRKGMFHEDH